LRLPQRLPKKGRIEIIPMIDTIFFLLVFFIMTSLSLIQMESHGVTLPTSRTAGGRPEQRMVVSLTRAGELYVDRDRVSEAEVLRRVREKVSANPDVAVVLNVDKDGDVRRFLRVFDLVKQADAGNVQIATAPPDALPVGSARR
jgi:biopolymer transport protein ExbD